MEKYQSLTTDGVEAQGKVKRIEVTATIIRADGSQHNLGTIYQREYTLLGFFKEVVRRFNKWRNNRVS